MEITGTVIEGSRKARALGFPTINIPLTSKEYSGVYIGKVTYQNQEYAASVFADTTREILEAHLLSPVGEWYGESVTISLVKKIREHKSFIDDASLQQAIADDVAITRAYFKTN